MKTNTSSLISRYIWLLNIIAEAGERGLSRAEIDRKWAGCVYNDNHEESIPRKTFYNYKCEIESMFEITLEAVRIDGHFRYRIAEEDSLQRSQVKRLLLNSLSINEALSRGGDMAGHILMEDIPSSGGAALSTILQAIRGSKVLQITHKSFKQGAQAHESTVYPFCVKLREQRWYMLAYNPEVDDSRVYALDRILSCNILPESFDAGKVRRFFAERKGVASPEDYFRDYYGVIINDEVPLKDVRVRVFGQMVNYFRSLPLHYSQVEVLTKEKGPDGAEPYSEFMFHIHPTIDFTSKLLSYGPDVQVISPKEYAAEVGGMVRLAAENYKQGD